jgi:hypothetical protein
VVEVRFLQQLAQVAGADLGRQRLLFVVFQVVIVGLDVVVWSVELLLIDRLFFDQPGARRISGDSDRAG